MIGRETASDSELRDRVTGCKLVATRDVVIDGERVVAGITRISKDHGWATMEHVFVPVDSDRGKQAVARAEHEARLFKFTPAPGQA